jgi:hypothetical protein
MIKYHTIQEFVLAELVQIFLLFEREYEKLILIKHYITDIELSKGIFDSTICGNLFD